jgi:hypothetical protein
VGNRIQESINNVKFGVSVNLETVSVYEHVLQSQKASNFEYTFGAHTCHPFRAPPFHAKFVLVILDPLRNEDEIPDRKVCGLHMRLLVMPSTSR